MFSCYIQFDCYCKRSNSKYNTQSALVKCLHRGRIGECRYLHCIAIAIHAALLWGGASSSPTSTVIDLTETQSISPYESVTITAATCSTLPSFVFHFIFRYTIQHFFTSISYLFADGALEKFVPPPMTSIDIQSLDLM